MNLKLYSKAMFSSFGLHYPTRSLFDAGDGVGCMLDKHAFAAERVLISHGHSDHTSGLPSLIGNRSSMKGASDKPLTVYAPESRNMKAYRDLIFQLYPRLNYPLTFEKVYGGYVIPLTDKTYIEAFDTIHTHASLGYKVMEKRQRLRADVPPAEAKDRKARGEAIHEDYAANTFTWLLDSSSFDLAHIENAATVVFDATFLTAAHRDDPTHSSVEEVLGWARDAKVKRAILAHISTRYSWAEAKTFIGDAVTRIGYTGKVDVIVGDKPHDL